MDRRSRIIMCLKDHIFGLNKVAVLRWVLNGGALNGGALNVCEWSHGWSYAWVHGYYVKQLSGPVAVYSYFISSLYSKCTCYTLTKCTGHHRNTIYLDYCHCSHSFMLEVYLMSRTAPLQSKHTQCSSLAMARTRANSSGLWRTGKEIRALRHKVAQHCVN